MTTAEFYTADRQGRLIETETTKMLTKQMNDKNLTHAERRATWKRIREAGYAIGMTGNMKNQRVFEVLK